MYHWPFLKRISQSPVDSPLTVQVISRFVTSFYQPEQPFSRIVGDLGRHYIHVTSL